MENTQNPGMNFPRHSVSHWLVTTSIPLVLTLCAVVQAPAVAKAFLINVIVQLDCVGVCVYQAWALCTTQLHGLFVLNRHLLKDE